MTHQIIGRDREIARLQFALGDGTDGLRLTHLSGPAGIGKTTIATRVLEDAARRGVTTLVIRGRAGSTCTPLAPVLEALPELRSIGLVAGDDAQLDPDRAGVALTLLVAELASKHPVIVMVDDVQALDETSIALLPYVCELPDSVNVSVLLVEQSDAPAVSSSYRGFMEQLSNRIVTRIELEQLSDAAIAEAVAGWVPDGADAEVVAEIVERAAGNPWFARELTTAWAHAQDEIPSSISNAAISRYRLLEEHVQELVRGVALCPDGARIEWIAELLAIDVTEVLELLDEVGASGLVAIDGPHVSISHPLVQDALLQAMSASEQRLGRRELVDAIVACAVDEVVAQRAIGHQLGCLGQLHDATACFLRAAAVSETRGQLNEAYADTVRALGVEQRVQQRLKLVTRCGWLAMELGLASAMQHWCELGRLAAALGDHEAVALAQLQQFWANGDWSAHVRLERAAQFAGSVGWAARAAATLARLTGDLTSAVSHDERAIKIARARGDERLEVLALEKLGCSRALMGDSLGAITSAQEAVDRAMNQGMTDTAVLAWCALVESRLEDLETTAALADAKAMCQYLERAEHGRRRPTALTWLANAYVKAGMLAEAEACCDEAYALDRAFQPNRQYRSAHHTPFVLLQRAEVAIETNHPDAERRAVEAYECIEAFGYHSWMVEATFVRARARALTRGVDAVLGELDGIEACGEPDLVARVARWMLRTSVISSSDAGIDRVRGIRANAAPWGTSRSCQLSLEEIDAVLAALDGRNDASRLNAVVERWMSAEQPLEARRVEAVQHVVALTSSADDGATESLLSVKSGFVRHGAMGDADLVASILRDMGVRSRAGSHASEVGGLTKRELHIARLVASGLRNGEIAHALRIKPKTVAAHLTNIYDKSGASTRMQLCHWVSEHDVQQVDLVAV